MLEVPYNDIIYFIASSLAIILPAILGLIKGERFNRAQKNIFKKISKIGWLCFFIFIMHVIADQVKERIQSRINENKIIEKEKIEKSRYDSLKAQNDSLIRINLQLKSFLHDSLGYQIIQGVNSNTTFKKINENLSPEFYFCAGENPSLDGVDVSKLPASDTLRLSICPVEDRPAANSLNSKMSLIFKINNEYSIGSSSISPFNETDKFYNEGISMKWGITVNELKIDTFGYVFFKMTYANKLGKTKLEALRKIAALVRNNNRLTVVKLNQEQILPIKAFLIKKKEW